MFDATGSTGEKTVDHPIKCYFTSDAFIMDG